ncbi:MAG: LPXTG cell wall anchor domain-containing protein [Ndongobacter sp.]|nr:LPXTG cell wall anchor domain-containing protein [Ndongobacter sp.]
MFEHSGMLIENGAVFQNEYEEDIPPAPPTVVKKTGAPKTGDRGIALTSAIALFVSGAGTVLIKRRKRPQI